MKLYWQAWSRGLRLFLGDEEGHQTQVGSIRETPRGWDALANTLGYDPGRAARGIPTQQEAREFVESFHPWELYGGSYDMQVEAEVRPAEG